ncbi:MAG: glutamate formimidoyltransferase [Bacteroidales bacterium]|jgi:glutamate formiminotransferase/formiminotetrahydrofolate cyclodeaminase|nr:glutamate formimidoyltransferase [Bacteroidales bacterium]HOL96865.1 glutamate formimidoyltransferase [Bacteroidales bacterium]HOM36854.1 glutamate formimidoyltransferase [Bacteroidales bacterium]HPD24325.1 glutamate formimidoyltransferase [Bacteroidales bacterium]HRS98422.1 glutamate formimidoyltransferase [Bacteroidales bacterium]
MKQIIECVPNFSEGRDMSIIKQITDVIESCEGVKLLNVDPGAATNRTVITFVGTPEEVCNAAFLAVKKASELIDMRKHKGAHPRFGATDVCPLIPVANISMEETVEYARKLAERIGKELSIPVYCYEFAAFKPERKNLANCRSGEYEGLSKKLVNPEWEPDFGPAEWNEHVAKTGATAVGARKFLVAYNINLNTTSVNKANSIAFDVREKGRVKREGHPVTGKPVLDEKGNKVYEPGLLKSVKAIGWYIEEYGIAQISMNLTDIDVTPVHVAFDTVCERAQAHGLRVTGSELVGVIPLKAILDAGKYFLKKQGRSTGIADSEIIKIAVKSLGLDELKPFDPKKNIIEYMLEEDSGNKLVDMDLVKFCHTTASESPAPGGGSISAYMGALGAALGTMVANLTANKYRHDDRWMEYSDWAEKGKYYHDELLKLVDEDTRAFNKIIDAFGLPKSNDEEKAARKKAIQEATKFAMEIPFKTMKLSYESMEVMFEMAKHGLEASISDASVGALAATAAVRGAFLNVKINGSGYDDKDFVNQIIAEGSEIERKAIELQNKILDLVNSKISK